eukprot:682657-Rhodomonas_salina.1
MGIGISTAGGWGWPKFVPMPSDAIKSQERYPGVPGTRVPPIPGGTRANSTNSNTRVPGKAEGARGGVPARLLFVFCTYL